MSDQPYWLLSDAILYVLFGITPSEDEFSDIRSGIEQINPIRLAQLSNARLYQDLRPTYFTEEQTKRAGLSLDPILMRMRNQNQDMYVYESPEKSAIRFARKRELRAEDADVHDIRRAINFENYQKKWDREFAIAIRKAERRVILILNEGFCQARGIKCDLDETERSFSTIEEILDTRSLCMSYTNSEGQDYRFHPIPAAAWSVENTAFNRSAVRIAEKLYVICPLRRDSFIAALQGHSSNSQRATTRQGRPSKNWGLIFRIAIEVMEDQSLAGHQMAQASMIAEIYERETGESVSKTTIRKKLKEWEPFAVFRPF